MDSLTFQNASALLALPFIWLIFVWRAWPRRFKPFGAFLLRLLILVCLNLALARPVISPTATKESNFTRPVLLVDQSASLGEIGQQALRQKAAELAQGQDALILYFADRAILTNPVNPLILVDLATALATGAELIRSENSRLILLSDGLATQGNTLAQATALAQQQIAVDVLLPTEADLRQWHNGQNEVRLTRLNVPPTLRQQEQFVIETEINSDVAVGTATLKLTQDHALLAESAITLQAGFNIFTISAKADTLGLHTYESTVTTAQDLWLENNRLAAVSQVYPPPKLLVVGEILTQVNRFIDLLDQAGFEPQASSATKLPDRLSMLEPYAGMVLLDVSARELSLSQMVAIQEFVRSLGRGLLVMGGRNSLSLGNYQDTPLAELLPLSLEPPPRKERPPVAFLLMIDHSGSMVEGSRPVTKLSMAKEAAIRATNILGPDDFIGVLMFDNNYEWVVPFQQVSSGAALLKIQQDIASIPPAGGTRILKTLQVGLPELAAQPVAGNGTRHAVLLTDGKSFDALDGDNGYEQILGEALKAHITLSTIAIGYGADQDLLAYLAKQGRGRYHFAQIPEELPALTIAESNILRSNSLQEDLFQVSVTAPHPMLRGFFNNVTLETSKVVSGYLALTQKQTAETALQVGAGDPLLSAWGYGLGRVGVWTADPGQEWATDWFTWHEASRFWGQVVGYTLPAPAMGLLRLKVEVKAAGVVTLMADGVTATGQTVDLANTQAKLYTPNGQEFSLNLPQISPGHYQQTVHLPNSGAYRLSVTQTARLEPPKTASIGFVVPYAPEYALPTEGNGLSLLQQIARITHGQTFSLAEPLSSFNSSLLKNDLPIELWTWLLGMALFLWPLEIAWRRWSGLRISNF